MAPPINSSRRNSFCLPPLNPLTIPGNTQRRSSLQPGSLLGPIQEVSPTGIGEIAPCLREAFNFIQPKIQDLLEKIGQLNLIIKQGEGSDISSSWDKDSRTITIFSTKAFLSIFNGVDRTHRYAVEILRQAVKVESTKTREEFESRLKRWAEEGGIPLSVEIDELLRSTQFDNSLKDFLNSLKQTDDCWKELLEMMRSVAQNPDLSKRSELFEQIHMVLMKTSLGKKLDMEPATYRFDELISGYQQDLDIHIWLTYFFFPDLLQWPMSTTESSLIINYTSPTHMERDFSGQFIQLLLILQENKELFAAKLSIQFLEMNRRFLDLPWQKLDYLQKQNHLTRFKIYDSSIRNVCKRMTPLFERNFFSCPPFLTKIKSLDIKQHALEFGMIFED